MNDIYILGIESSCDDTSAAVLRNGVLLSNVTASQEVHKQSPSAKRGAGGRPSHQTGRHYKRPIVSCGIYTWPRIDGFFARRR